MFSLLLSFFYGGWSFLNKLQACVSFQGSEIIAGLMRQFCFLQRFFCAKLESWWSIWVPVLSPCNCSYNASWWLLFCSAITIIAGLLFHSYSRWECQGWSPHPAHYRYTFCCLNRWKLGIKQTDFHELRLLFASFEVGSCCGRNINQILKFVLFCDLLIAVHVVPVLLSTTNIANLSRWIEASIYRFKS